MKTLIITTGDGRYLEKVWLPSLRIRGEYNGDILIVDYDLPLDVVQRFQKQKNIIIKPATQLFKIIPSDRFRAFYEILGDLYQNYDVIMSVDADVEFFKPIQPLFDAAQEKIRYVAERKTLRNWVWVKFDTVPNAEKYWEKMVDRLIINVGMFIGPSKLIYEAFKFMAENLRYKNSWGFDQLLFNAFIYNFDVPSEKIDIKWNFGYKGYYIIGNVLDILDNEIAILHKRNM